MNSLDNVKEDDFNNSRVNWLQLGMTALILFALGLSTGCRSSGSGETSTPLTQIDDKIIRDVVSLMGGLDTGEYDGYSKFYQLLELYKDAKLVDSDLYQAANGQSMAAVMIEPMEAGDNENVREQVDAFFASLNVTLNLTKLPQRKMQDANAVKAALLQTLESIKSHYRTNFAGNEPPAYDLSINLASASQSYEFYFAGSSGCDEENRILFDQVGLDTTQLQDGLTHSLCQQLDSALADANNISVLYPNNRSIDSSVGSFKSHGRCYTVPATSFAQVCGHLAVTPTPIVVPFGKQHFVEFFVDRGNGQCQFQDVVARIEATNVNSSCKDLSANVPSNAKLQVKTGNQCTSLGQVDFVSACETHAGVQTQPIEPAPMPVTNI